MGEYDVAPPPERLANRVQLRTAFSADSGELTRFVSQLEYWHEGAWKVIVRYDHGRGAPGSHDVTEDGLHRDVYRDGEKFRVESITGPIPADEGFDFAEEDLRENGEAYIKRFERWHDISGGTNP